MVTKLEIQARHEADQEWAQLREALGNRGVPMVFAKFIKNMAEPDTPAHEIRDAIARAPDADVQWLARLADIALLEVSIQAASAIGE